MRMMLRFDPWAARLAAFLSAALAAGSAAYWVLHWPTATGDIRRGVPAAAMDESVVPPDAARLARLLGAAGGSDSTPQVSAGAQRWRLVGVVAGAGGRGAALIAEDDKPAKAYTVGSLVAEGWYLKAVAPRRAMLATTPSAPATVTLELPRNAEAAVMSAAKTPGPASALVLPSLKAAP